MYVIMGDNVTDKPQGKTETFSYIEVPKQGQLPPEEFREKIARKTRENPSVPNTDYGT